MPLTNAQIADFRRDGYLVLPRAVPADLVNRALRAIYHRIGEGVPAEALRTWRSQSWFPELQKQEVITDLFSESGALLALQQLMGKENAAPLGSGQLALRFPRALDERPEGEPWPHIDGVHSRDNGVPQGTVYSFSALVGIFLTDVNDDNAGNFTVWPGSHLKMQEYFREHGIDALINEGRTPRIERGAALQIKAKAGDAVLAHYQLLHGVAGNYAPAPRFATFFRIKHPDHDAHRLECLTDLWREWPGVREMVAAQ